MRKSLILIALLFLVGWVHAQNFPPLPIDSAVRYGKLENGLTYYIRHNGYPENRASFYIAQKVGSMQEEENQAGLAHFLEHLAFNGTKNFPGKTDLRDYLQSVGAKFGPNINAYTSFDETIYTLNDIPVVRDAIVDSCLLVLHDWSSFISMNDEQIDAERLVIKEEWRTRSGAWNRLWEKQLPVIFAGSKYADRMPIGKMEVVENFPYQTIKDYYHTWYRPDLQGIIIVGDIDVEQVEAKIKTLFADIPTPVNPAERIYYPVPDNDAPILSVATDPEARETVVTLFVKHDVLPSEVKLSQAGLGVSILKALSVSMLSARLDEITQSSDAPFGYAYADDGPFIVSKTKDAWVTAASSKDGMINETLAALVRENRRLILYGFTDAEVERAKADLLSSYETAYNNREKQLNNSYVQEYVRHFTDDEAIPGIELEYQFVQQALPHINAAAINPMIQQLLQEKNWVITVTGPEKAGLTYPTEADLLGVIAAVQAEQIEPYFETVSNEPLIGQLPKAGSVVKTKHDAELGATVWTLSNGMKVVVKKTDFKDDQIIMSGIAYGGTSLFPDGDIYNAEMARRVPAIGGLGSFSATDLRKVLAGNSADVQSDVDRWGYTQGFSGNSRIKDLETLLQLTYLHFTAPRKDEEAFHNFIEMVKIQLRNQASDPNYIFHTTRTRVTHGENPRKQTITLADAERIDYDRMIEIYRQLYANPGSFVFTFVGSVDEAALRPMVEQYLAALPSGNRKATYRTVADSIQRGRIEHPFTQRMETPKTSVFENFSGTIPYNQKNMLLMTSLQQVLDRVYQRTVRDEVGGTYGVGVLGIMNRIPAGQTMLQVFFDTDPEKANEIIPIITRELAKISEQGPEESDLLDAKQYLVKRFQENEKRNEYWLSILSTRHFYGDDRYTHYLSMVHSITPEDIRAFAQQLLSQGNHIEVIMNPEK